MKHSAVEKRTIEYIKGKIENLHKGSKVLSTEYKDSKSKLEIQCEKGHTFDMTWGDISQNHWCTKCSGTEKRSFEYVKNQIENKLYPGSKLLSTEYKNSKSKLEIQCKKKHKFEMSWSFITQNRWCKICEMSNKLKESASNKTLDDLG